VFHNRLKSADLFPQEGGDCILVLQVDLVPLNLCYFRQDHLVHLERSDGLEWDLGNLKLRALD
jgi:hypothetical protein